MKNKLAKLGKRFMAMALSVAMLASGSVSTVFAGTNSSTGSYHSDPGPYVESGKEEWSLATNITPDNSPKGVGYLVARVEGNNTIYDGDNNRINSNAITYLSGYANLNVKEAYLYYITDYNSDGIKQNNYGDFTSSYIKIASSANNSELSIKAEGATNGVCRAKNLTDDADWSKIWNRLYEENGYTEEQAANALGVSKDFIITPDELGEKDSLVMIPILFCTYQPWTYIGSAVNGDYVYSNKGICPYPLNESYSEDFTEPDTETMHDIKKSLTWTVPADNDYEIYSIQSNTWDGKFATAAGAVSKKVQGLDNVKALAGYDYIPATGSNSYHKKNHLDDTVTVTGTMTYKQPVKVTKHAWTGYKYTSEKEAKDELGASFVKAEKNSAGKYRAYYSYTDTEWQDAKPVSITEERTISEMMRSRGGDTNTFLGKKSERNPLYTCPASELTVGKGDLVGSYLKQEAKVSYIQLAYNYSYSDGKITASNNTSCGHTTVFPNGQKAIAIENNIDASTHCIEYKGAIPEGYLVKSGVGIYCRGMFGSSVSYDALIKQNTHSGDSTYQTTGSSLISFTKNGKLNTSGAKHYENKKYVATDYKPKNHKGYAFFTPSIKGNSYQNTLADIYSLLNSRLDSIGYTAGYKSAGESFDGIELLVPSWAGDGTSSHRGNKALYTYTNKSGVVSQYDSVSGVLKAVADDANGTTSNYTGADLNGVTRDNLAWSCIGKIYPTITGSDLKKYLAVERNEVMKPYGKNLSKNPAQTGFSATIQDPTFKVNSYVIPVEVDINGDTGKVKNITIDTSHKTTIQLSNRKYSNGKYYKSVYTANDNDSFYVLFKGNTCRNADLHTALKDTLTKTAWSGDDGGHITDAYAKVSDWAANSNVYAGYTPRYIKTKNQNLVFGVQRDDPSKGYTAYVFRITVDGTPVGDPPTDQKLVKTNEITLQDYELSVVYPNLIGSTADYTYAITTNNKSKYGAYTIANTVTLGGDKNKLFGISGDASVELYKSERYRDKIVSPVNDKKANVNTNDRKYINYAYEISRQSFRDERIASGISYTKGSSSNGYQFATSYLGLSTGVVPKDGNKKLTADGDIRNSVALFSRLQSVMQMSSSDSHATHPFMYARRVNSNGKVSATTVGNVTFESVKFAWQDRANKYQSKAIDLAKVDASTRLDASVRAQDNKLTYRGVYLDNHVNTEKDEFKNGIVSNFYPEVRMYMQTHDSDLANISDTKQIASGVGVLTMGEEKRVAQNNSMYVTKIYMENDKDPVTGTIYSDTMSTGSQAENSAGTDPVIYAGSDITLNVNTNFSMSIYGYAVDGIHKEVNTADAEKKTRGKADSISDETMTYGVDGSGNPITVRYSDIVKSNEDLDKAWGNKNNSAQLFADYKAYVKNMLDPDNIGVDVKLTVSGDSSYVTKEYNNFTCDLANQISTNKAKPTQQYVYPIEIEDGKVNTETVYYKALIEQIKKDYGCNSFEDAEKVFNESGMVESYIKGIESSNSDFNKSQTALEAGDDGKQTEVPNKHWYDEEVRTIVVRRYATENVKFGGAVLQDKIDYGAAPTSTGNSYKTVTGTWEVTLYFKNLNNYFGGDGQVYNPSNPSGTKQTGINSLNIFAPSMKLTGADFKIPSSSTQNMGD